MTTTNESGSRCNSDEQEEDGEILATSLFSEEEDSNFNRFLNELCGCTSSN